jgi:predicted O-methyltransferase YrrM
MNASDLDAVLLDPRRKYGPPEHLHRVIPGFTRRDLALLFAKNKYRRGAEIGVADGRYSLVLCEAIPDLELLCVDPWHVYRGNPRGGPQSQHEANFALAQARLSKFNVSFVRAHSGDAAPYVHDGSLDFVYIDGNHSYEYVATDLRRWSPKVRSGGIVAGHDFYNFRHAGVVDAVTEYTERHGITEWHLCDEREPSWWWVNP